MADRLKAHAGTATEVAKAQGAAASRGYAAGSRDGAREMRLVAARLVEAKGCICEKWDIVVDADWDGPSLLDHDEHCPVALAEAIRRLPDGGGE